MPTDFNLLSQNLQNAAGAHFQGRSLHIPQAKEIIRIFSGLKNLLYQYILHTDGPDATGLLRELAPALEKQILNSKCLLCKGKADCTACQQQAAQITQDFLQALPDIQKLILSDVRAAYNGDPAAVDEIEALLCYPGVQAIAYQRMAHFLHEKGVRILPRIVTEYAHSNTGIDIHPGAKIGPGFFIDHGTGVVIGETCVIGSNVKLYQGVTLGAKSFPLDENGNPIKGIKRHPNIGNGVIIYAETTILGDITIGEGSIIGANKWITQSVPPHSKID